jgi:hypothetical protein
VMIESTRPKAVSSLTISRFDDVRGGPGPRRGRATSSEGGIQGEGDFIVVVGEEMTVGIHGRADV